MGGLEENEMTTPASPGRRFPISCAGTTVDDDGWSSRFLSIEPLPRPPPPQNDDGRPRILHICGGKRAARGRVCGFVVITTHSPPAPAACRSTQVLIAHVSTTRVFVLV